MNPLDVSSTLSREFFVVPSVTRNKSDTDLHHAAEMGRVDWAAQAIADGAGLNKTDKAGDTALIIAARKGDTAMMTFLLDAGAAKDFWNNKGNDALMESIIAGQEKAATLCLTHLFNVASKNEEEKTALHLAAEQGMTLLLDMLLKHGAALNAKDDHGRTPLMLAEGARTMESFSYLLAQPRIALELQDADGRTVLMRAFNNGHRAAAEALLQAGASMRPEDARGNSARMMAERWGMGDLAQAAFEKYDVTRMSTGSLHAVQVMKPLRIKPH